MGSADLRKAKRRYKQGDRVQGRKVFGTDTVIYETTPIPELYFLCKVYADACSAGPRSLCAPGADRRTWACARRPGVRYIASSRRRH